MLRGDRLLLRSVERRDINIFYDIWYDDEIRKYDGGFTIPPGKDYMLEKFDEFLLLDKKYLTIVNEKEVTVGYITYEPVGDCCDIYNLGITIGKNFWDRKYGQEAIKILLEFLFMKKGAHRVELEVMEENLRAINCYKKSGFVTEGVKRNRYFSEGFFHNVTFMGILRDDYYKLHKINN